MRIRNKNKKFTPLIICFVGIWAATWLPGLENRVQAQPPNATAETVPDFDSLDRSIETGLRAEKEIARELEREIADLESLGKVLPGEINAYKMRLSTHGNMIHQPGTKLADLEKAMAVHQTSLETVSSRLESLAEKRDVAAGRLASAEEQLLLNEKRLYAISARDAGSSRAQATVENLQGLIRLLTRKINFLETIKASYADVAGQLKSLRDDLGDFSEKLDRHIQSTRKAQLFQRGYNPLSILNSKRIHGESAAFVKNINKMASASYWEALLSEIWKSVGFLLVSGSLLFAIVLGLLIRLSRLAVQYEKRPESTVFPHRRLAIRLFRGSIVLFGITMFFYTLALARNLFAAVPIVRYDFYILVVWLFTRWARDYFRIRNEIGEGGAIPPELMAGLDQTIVLVRWFCITYFVMLWLFGPESVILFLGRLVFEIVLLLWYALFWAKYRRIENGLAAEDAGRFLKSLHTGAAAVYMILCIGLLSELAGYGHFAVYWYTSWGCGTIVLLWGGVLFFALREWERHLVKEKEAKRDETPTLSDTLKWLLIRFCWPLWFLAATAAMIAAWGGDRIGIWNMFLVLNHPIQFGSIRLNLMGIVYAFVILSTIHAAAKILRNHLVDKLLPAPKYERGLKISVTSITVYLFWMIGIILSLSLMGVSTASLAVIFGALGVGLGFGLQNIFNNFISGIILLFERPIQVGDYIEINGIWGEVREINIRSTHVLSFDNASLIIPNSEFISKQVTNWTFKDFRIRRIIKIGVAYGSDLELVRSTLLEIAENTMHVLKNPKPNVVLLDYGDSAIMFMLRYWTHADYFYATQTDILFEVDRLFKERNIEIPFPQQDLHIRSVDENAKFKIDRL